MTPGDLMAKALQAATSAKMLLAAGDADGACNRAQYATFDAAPSALLAIGADAGKTHKGVLNAFSAQFVRDGPLSKGIGRQLKHAETVRYVADHEGTPINLEHARALVEAAERVVEAVRSRCMPQETRRDT